MSSLRRSHVPLITTLVILVFFYLPIVVLVADSFNLSSAGGAWKGFTFKWYAKLLENRQIWDAIRNSFVVAVGSTFVATVLGTISAFALHRYSSRLQQVHSVLIYMPLVVPEILMGISLLLLFIAIKVPLSLFTTFVAHVTFSMSYVTMVVLSRLQDFDYNLVEAAQDLGASTWVTTRRVVLPLLGPGIIAGALLAFTLSVDDFVITFFVAGPGSTTLPVKIYSMIKHSHDLPVVNALSTLMLAVTFAVVLLSQRLTEKKTK